MNPNLKGWKSYLFLEGFPFLMLFGLFGILSIVNWDYESKLFHRLSIGSSWMAVYAGPLMLACALALACTASVILSGVRKTFPAANDRWYRFVPLLVVTLSLVLPSLFIIILGPAMISIMESMAQVQGH